MLKDVFSPKRQVLTIFLHENLYFFKSENFAFVLKIKIVPIFDLIKAYGTFLVKIDENLNRNLVKLQILTSEKTLLL
jgi:hypothetical protein